ncbi:MAG: NAD-dependent epimerase/dehydratase family protein [Candidatus Magasanikbacteria bacterium]|nr:NAD-dependent epimerase/dehydratase family protein [Candidatus Magasanikbacteria bacterium]
MSKCIVTGGAGFIGSHITDKLIELGNEVLVIDNLSLGKKEFVNSKAEFHQVDIRNFEEIKNLFEGVGVVFHLAAEPRLPISIEKPIETNDINVSGTLNILEASRLAGVKKVVFSSSCAVYGDCAVMPITENYHKNPKSPYGLHKLIGEQYMKLYSELFDLPTVCLRYFNVYGPRKLADGGYPMVIPVFLKQIAEGKKMTVIGTGENTRDYVHVNDVADANVKAWESEVVNGESINIGFGEQTSVNKIAEHIGGEKEYLEPRIGEMCRAQANIEKAKELLNWEPAVKFEEGIAGLKKEMGL